MRKAFLFVSLVSECAVVAAVQASTLTVQTASSYASTAGCDLQCDATPSAPCALVCDNQNRSVVEFATANLGVNPISFTASATADGVTLGGRTPAHVTAGFDVEFTLDAPAFVYVEWNIFYPVADNNFLPPPLPPEGIWIGQLQAGSYYARANHEVSGEGSQASGIFVRLIPNPFGDCDNDGTFDYIEIINGSQQDANFNGIPDDCEVPGDLDGDGHVGAPDLAILLGAWGGSGAADFDGNGVVGAADLAMLLGLWG